MQDLMISMLEEIIPKLDDLNAAELEKEECANVISILGLDTKEVEMCKVLWAILDYKQNNKRVYIPGFVNQVLKLDVGKEELETASVYREFYIPDNEKRIDLVIESTSLFIPIEAKIYADDQNDQCSDYLAFADKCKNSNKCSVMYYLTLEKRMPTEKSVSGNDALYERIKPIAWKDVLLWLENENVKTNISSVIEQYKKALKLLINEDWKIYKMEINEVLNTPERIQAALEIEKAINEKKIVLMKSLFEEINTRVSRELNLNYDSRLNDPWPIEDAVNNYYCKRLSSSTYPALTYNMGHIYTDIEKNDYYLVLRFEIEWRPYIGYGVMKRDSKGGISIVEKYSDELFAQLKNRVNCTDDIKLSKGWWIKWEYVPTYSTDLSEEVPNFRELNASYISLYDENNKNRFVEKVVNCIKKYRDSL